MPFQSPRTIARKVCQLATDYQNTIYLHKLNENSVIRYWQNQEQQDKGDFIGCYDANCKPEFVEEDLIDVFGCKNELFFRAQSINSTNSKS